MYEVICPHLLHRYQALYISINKQKVTYLQMSKKNTFCNDACYEVNKFNDPCNWFKGRIFFIITSEYTRWKLKCTFLIFHNINILHTLPLPLSLPLFLSLSLSLSLSLIACWFKPLVQTSDDYWQGSPPLPPPVPRPHKTLIARKLLWTQIDLEL